MLVTGLGTTDPEVETGSMGALIIGPSVSLHVFAYLHQCVVTFIGQVACPGTVSSLQSSVGDVVVCVHLPLFQRTKSLTGTGSVR